MSDRTVFETISKTMTVEQVETIDDPTSGSLL